jgi:hypothetical protein
MREAHVHRLSAGAPDDTASIEAAIADGRIHPEYIMAIFGKTEGNGCVNDFSRGLASLALRHLLQHHLGPAAGDIPLVMSGGTEGGLAPHWLVLEARPSSDRLVAVLAKAEPARSGRLCGFRHTMQDGSDIAPTRHARALVGGVLGGLVGHGELFASGGAEHQGPEGGGPVALIANAAQEVQ